LRHEPQRKVSSVEAFRIPAGGDDRSVEDVSGQFLHLEALAILRRIHNTATLPGGRP